MIISHKHKFIFLKTKKTAGTSIEMALSKFCGPDDILTPVAERYDKRRSPNAQNYAVGEFPIRLTALPYLLFGWGKKRGFYDHAKARRVRGLIGRKVWNSYFKFSFERNPWERQVSLYHFRRSSSLKPASFEEFLAMRSARINNAGVYALGGDIAVDFLGRYENLEDDFRKVLDILGLDAPTRLPCVNASKRASNRHYRDYYSEQTRNLISRWYRFEIEKLGYVF